MAHLHCRMTHDRNRAELKELYERVHNWKTVYSDSLNGPASGIGRIIISSVSSSSGISSDEVPSVPMPPSPFGRITPTELPSNQEEGEEEGPFTEYLETRNRRRPKMNVALLQAKDELRTEKSTVFTCGANLHPRQIHANVNVKQSDTQKPKMVRDVATQTPHRRVIQKTQTEQSGELTNCKFASTQCESHKVDCMTQIGWIKAQKAQQVDGSTISAAMEVAESTPSCASAEGGAIPLKVQETYTTGPSFIATVNCETATPKVKKQDLMFQIGDYRILTECQGDAPVRRSSDIESINSGAFEAHVPTKILEFGITKETYDVMAQIKPFTKKVNFGSQPDLQILTKETNSAVCKPKHKESEIQVVPIGLKDGSVEQSRSISDVDLQTEIDGASLKMETETHRSKSYEAETRFCQAPKVSGTHDGMKYYRSSSQQTLIKTSTKEAESQDLMCRSEFTAVDNKKVVHSNEEYAIDTSYSELNVLNRSLSDIDLQTNASRMEEVSINNERRKLKFAAECTCFERCPREIQSRLNLVSDNFSCILHQPKPFHSIPPTYAQCETPMVNLKYLTSFNKQTASCQVGTKLVPKEIKVSAINVGISDRLVAGRLGLSVNSLLCPASVECRPVLTEDAGIQIVDLKKVDVVNIQTEENTYSAGVQTIMDSKLSTSTVHPHEACVIEFSSSGSKMSRADVYFAKQTEDRGNIVRRLLTDAECQFVVQELKSSAIEHNLTSKSSDLTFKGSCEPKRVFSNASCQVGTILYPETMEVSAVPLQVAAVDQCVHDDKAVDAVICPTRVIIRPELSESVGINVARVRGMDHMNVKIADRLYKASVVQTPRMRSKREAEYVGRQICILEMSTRNAQPDDYTMTASPNITNGNFTITLDRPKHQQRAANQISICPSCHCQLETSWKKATPIEASATKQETSTTSKMTQVGTTLTPTRVQIMEVNVKAKDSPSVSDCNIGVQSVACPCTVELISSLSETPGIKVRDLCEVDTVNILAEGSTYYANVKRSTATLTTKIPEVCQKYIKSGGKNVKSAGISTAAKKLDAYSMNEQIILRQAKFEVINSSTHQLCDLCNGTGRKSSGQASSQQQRTLSATSNTYQSVAYHQIMSLAVSNVECQVGAVLRPTRVHIANIEIQPRTSEIAEQMGIKPSTVICPSTIELQTELVEHTGIQVIDVKDVANMELVAGSSIFETNFHCSADGTRKGNIPNSRPFMDKMNIIRDRSGFTIGQAVGHKVAGYSATNKETFSLQDVGCQFAIRRVNTGTFCNHCGRSEQSQKNFLSFRSSSGDTSRKPSFIHQRASTPVSKTVECQVGMLLRPSRIQIGKIGVKPRNRAIAEYLGMNVDSILCPTRVEMAPEIREGAGLEVMSISDVTCTEVHAGEVVIDGDVQIRPCERSVASVDFQRKPRLLFQIQGGQGGFTIGQNASYKSVETIGTDCENFILSDIGCDITLKKSTIGKVCTTCQGSGRTAFVSEKPISKIIKTKNNGSTHQYSTLMPSTKVAKSIPSESKSCQVGTVLTPTCVNIAGVEMFPQRKTSTVSSNAIVYPAAIEVDSRLSETAGIQIRDIATIDSINVNMAAQSYIANTQQISTPKKESCVLEVKSFHPEAVRGELSTYRMAVGSLASSGKFNLANVGCEFRLKETITSQRKILEQKTAAEMQGNAGVQVKDSACQVGITLTPTTVQVADVCTSSKEQRVTTSLGLKVDAVICPSTVELEARLTETGGVTVTDIKDVKEVGISVGNEKGIVSVTGRNLGLHETNTTSKFTEPVYLSFNTRSPISFQDSRLPHGKVSETSLSQVSKPVDQNARCTFRIRSVGDSQRKYPALLTQVGSLREDIRRTNATCQVGVTMIPCKMNVSPAKLIIDGKVSADTLGLSVPSVVQSTTCELESRISEKTGIDIAQINAIENLQLQLGNEIFNATVVGGGVKPTLSKSTSPPFRKYLTSITGYPIVEPPVASKAYCEEEGTSKAIGPYLVTMKETALENRSVLEVGSLTLGGKRLQLRVDADLRGKLNVQTTQHPSSGGRFIGFLDSSRRLQSSGDQLLPRRPNSRLCDVACEALIKPETLEKRLQTVFI